ncbi:MAG TPA: DUF882 domain-containing protein [Polyangia bacterium]|nr:DUF882 domain-containing protein [Polyangia bacterium]
MTGALLLAMLLAQEQTPPPDADTTPAIPVKKQRWLDAKAAAAAAATDTFPARKRPPPARAALPVLSLYNTWTDEVLPVPEGRPPPPEEIDRFLRCHFTNQSTHMDPRLLPLVVRAAKRFRAPRVEVVSGYRSPKYNLWLRKKGHEVARESEHPRGEAVDFRLPQVQTRVLLRFVRSQRMGGVGYYPDSKFVHCDCGRLRYWRGH